MNSRNAMNITVPKIIDLGKMVTAAQEEFDMAVTYHEVWKPAAYDIRPNSGLVRVAKRRKDTRISSRGCRNRRSRTPGDFSAGSNIRANSASAWPTK